MKKLNRLLIAFVITLLVFAGCEKAKEALDVTFDATFHADLNVEVPVADRGSFYASETIDPLADPNIEKYLDKIKSWEIQEVTGEIIEISKNITLVTADLIVYSASKSATWHFENEALFLGKTLTLDNANGQWDTIALILDEKTVFTIDISGSTDQDNVTFTIRVTIKTKVTANPL